MKKLLLIALVCFALVGCSGKDKVSLTCSSSAEGELSAAKVEFTTNKDGYIIKEKSIFSSSYVDIAGVDSFEEVSKEIIDKVIESLAKSADELKEEKGVTVSHGDKGEFYERTVTIDYKTAEDSFTENRFGSTVKKNDDGLFASDDIKAYLVDKLEFNCK